MSQERLKKFIGRISEMLGEEIAPESLQENHASLSRDEIKDRFPVRYEAAKHLLGADNGDESKGQARRIRALNNLATFIDKHESHGSVLRTDQVNVFQDIYNGLEKGVISGYVKLPTGVGKTVLFSQIVDAIKVPTLIVVPNRILVPQTGQKLEQFTELEYGQHSSDKKALSGRVDIITYQSLIRLVKSGRLAKDAYDVVILDEAHRSLGDETSKIIHSLSSIKIGFTATPEYEQKSLVDVLPTCFHTMDLVEAAKMGLVSSFKCIIAKTQTNLDDVTVAGGEYNQKQLEAAVNTEGRNQAAVELYKSTFKDRAAVVYCSGVNHAKQVTRLFKSSGVQASCIHGQMTTTERAAVLEAFQKGKIDVLVNAKVLIEGFDEPKASVCINLHPTLSKLVAEQRAGRVLRNDPAQPNKWAYIVDFLDETKADKKSVLFSSIAGAAEVLSNVEISDKVTDEREARETLFQDKPQLTINGLQVVYDTEEVLEVTRENAATKDVKLEAAPAGWVTKAILMKRLKVGLVLLERGIDEYLKQHPTAVQKFKGRTHPASYCSPELVVYLTSTLTERVTKAPEGWKNSTTLFREWGNGAQTIEKKAREYRDEHPEWFRSFSAGSSFVEHYHPDLVKLLQLHFKEIAKQAPAGWLTPAQLVTQLSSSPPKVKGTANKLRESNPEWFQEYMVKGGPTEHYHPKVVAHVIKELQRKSAPEGWQSLRSLKRNKIMSAGAVEKIAGPLRKTNPEMFGVFDTPSGEVEYFSPMFVELLKSIQESLANPPEGWKSHGDIKAELRLSDHKARDYIKMVKDLFPTDVALYKKGNISTDYVSQRAFTHIKRLAQNSKS